MNFDEQTENWKRASQAVDTLVTYARSAGGPQGWQDGGIDALRNTILVVVDAFYREAWAERSERTNYARAALAGLLANTEYQHRQGATVAEEAFDYAEAMIAEAKKRDAEPRS